MPATTPATTLADRALIRLSGEDVRGFLQGLVTNDVSGALPVWAGLLTAQGKALFDFIVWADSDDLLLDCEASQADALARRLTLYRLRRPITIARDESLVVEWAPDADAEPESGIHSDPRGAWLGCRWIGRPSDRPRGDDGWRQYRLERGVVEGLAEIGSDKTLWLEANAAELNGVSFTKGCYVGQENTARMNWRQKVNRRLVVVRADAEPEGARAWYPELGLAVVHRRVETLAGDPSIVMPKWLETALGQETSTPA